MHGQPRSYWNPLVAGLMLGLVLLATFLVTGHGLGASGVSARMTALMGSWVLPEAAAANA
jgi:hypothetical protein